MSETSTSYTSAFTSTSVAENKTVILTDDIKKYDMTKLIDFLRREKDLRLSEKTFKILKIQEVNGYTFFKITKEEYIQDDMARGPATALVNFVKECKNKKLKAFSLYLSLSKMLAEYDLDSDGIDSISLFSFLTYEIQDSNKVFKHCMRF